MDQDVILGRWGLRYELVNRYPALLPQYLAIGATMIVVDVIVMTGYTGLAARLLQWMRTPRQQTAVNRTFSGLFVVAALALSLVRRTATT